MIQINLSGKTAVVTGGGQGIGAVICRYLAEAGAKVIINYFEDEAGVNRARAEETSQLVGPAGIAMAADVRDFSQVGVMLDKTIDRFGSLDIVINNAAILRDRTLKKMSREEWDMVIDTNLTGVFNVCREAVQRMAANGRIVNMASIASFVGFFGQSNYAAAKAGVVALTKVLSREVAKQNITVNAVAPGVVLTEMGKTIPDEVRDEMLKSIPLGRFGLPEEIAQTVLFLSSGLASYITGQTIHVNGGWIG